VGAGARPGAARPGAGHRLRLAHYNCTNTKHKGWPSPCGRIKAGVDWTEPAIVLDKDPEEIGTSWSSRPPERGHFTLHRSGKRTQETHCKSFHGGIREESLDLHYFAALEQVQQIIEAW
jgi:hypothetical protein